MKIIDEVYPLIKCEARLSDDGTLWIKTDTKSAEQTKRVLIEYAENSFCKTFYQDCDEPPTIPMFAESEEAYKAWTGEEMGGGRLIDADKLKKQLDTVYNEMANERERKGLRLARWFLISAPTVSADRPHGHWIVVAYQKDGEEYIRSCTCSECGSKSALRTNFCPNCGALMLKGGDDE